MSDRAAEILNVHRQTINPAWIDLIEAIGLPVDGLRAEGSWLHTRDGSSMLDMMAGFGTAVLGHNRPEIVAALHAALDKGTPTVAPMGVIPEAGHLAARLVNLAGHDLTKVQFASTGAEAVDTALKLAAAATRRRRFINVRGGFHGLSVGATALAGSDWWRAPFPDLWLSTSQLNTIDLGALDQLLAPRDVAALVLEVVPGSDAGDGWSADALRRCAELCHSYETLLVIDEVQTALGRTGNWFAFHDAGPTIRPDMVLVSKALTSGMVPLSVILMTETIYQSVYGQPGQAKIHGSTLAGNRLAMACGLAVLDVLEKDKLPGRAAELGQRIRDGLAQAIPTSTPQILGRGLLLAIEAGETPEQANDMCIKLLRSGVLVGMVSHAPRYLRVTPALTMDDSDVDRFITALAALLS